MEVEPFLLMLMISVSVTWRTRRRGQVDEAVMGKVGSFIVVGIEVG
jgi:hypothetical protein